MSAGATVELRRRPGAFDVITLPGGRGEVLIPCEADGCTGTLARRLAPIASDLATLPPGPVVVDRCDDPTHVRRVFAGGVAPCARCAVTELPFARADQRAHDGDESHACAVVSITIECARRWLLRASHGRSHLPGWIACANAFEAAGELRDARDRFDDACDERRALTELSLACGAIDRFQTSQRRGLLDEALLRAHRALTLALRHDGGAAATWRTQWSDL